MRDDVVDRRSRQWQSFFYSFFMRRRVTPHKNSYVDVHEPAWFYIILGVVLLCAADAFLTLFILSNGGAELNPLMDILLQKDAVLFFYIKFFVTAVGVLFFLAHKNFVFFRRVRGYHLVFACFLVYATLFAYEIYLISHIPGGVFA